MSHRRAVVALLLIGLWSREAIAQSSPAPTVNYHQLFERLFAPVTEAIAANGGPAMLPINYGGAAVLASLLASQLVSLPTGSNGGAFSWSYDSALGTFTRTVDSFGPQSAERAQTIGRYKVNVGFTHQRFTFDRLDGQAIAIASAGAVSTTPALHLAERVSLSRADVSLNTVFVNFGLTSRLDIAMLLPMLSAAVDGSLEATLRRGNSNGPIVLQTTNSASARETRRGDPLLRVKWNFVRERWGGVALAWELRSPSQNQLGTEGFKMQVIASGALRGVNVHMNIGGSSYSCNLQPVRVCSEDINAFFVRGGIDKAVTPRLTLATDVQLQHVGVGFKNMRTTPEGIELGGGSGALTPSTGDAAASVAMTGKVNLWRNLLVTATGMIGVGGGLIDRFTPIFGLDYTW